MNAPAHGPEVELDRPAFIHPTALIHGKVRIGRDVSLWPYTVIRAELAQVQIGEATNIQDFVMIHVGYTQPTIIGKHCSITHHCTVHGATIGDNCLIGVNATIMDGCVVGENSIVAGGAFLKEGTAIPPNSIVMGAPGKVTKTRNNWVANRFNAALYLRNAEHYAKGKHRAWHGDEFHAFAKSEMERLQKEFEALGVA
jgi:carbonic anhydrase/acetyltransferase-like protein (isoleucine patch superfamily)